jgi:molecular chaperone GrpE
MNGQSNRPVNDAEPAEEIEVQAESELETESTNESVSDESVIEQLRAQVDENWNLYVRAAAETENVRKRAARDVGHAHKYALEAFAKEMLAVRDSFELGLEAAETADAASLVEGSEATLKLLTATLERFGIAEIDPLGEPFDPDMHEAISLQPASDAEPGSVLVVVQKGFSLNGRLLRPAMVVVAADAATE